jgi:hypothetical protein
MAPLFFISVHFISYFGESFLIICLLLKWPITLTVNGNLYGLLKQMDSEFWTDDEIEIILKIITMKNEMLKKKKIP